MPFNLTFPINLDSFSSETPLTMPFSELRLSTILRELTGSSKKDFIICSLAILLIGLMTYGYTFFSFTYNNDGIFRISEVDVTFQSGLVKGRWMYALLSNLFFTSFRLPLFHGMLVVLLLSLCTILLWYIFEIRAVAERILVGGVFMSMPLFIHYIYFSGDAEVYGSGMLLILISLLFFSRQTIIGYGIATMLIVMALGCYPALFSFATVLYAFYVVHAFTKTPEIRPNMLLFAQAMGVCLTGLLCYYLFTKGMLAIMGLKMLEYRNAHQLTIPLLISQFPFKLIWVFLLHGLYVLTSSIWYQAFFVLGLVGMFRMMIGKGNFTAARSLYVMFLILSVLVTSLSIYLVTLDTWPYSGFQFGIIILASLLVLYGVRLPANRLKPIGYVLACLFILSNMRIDNAIALKYELKRDGGQRIVSHLIHDVIGSEGYVKGKTKIAFVGSLRNNSNYGLRDLYPETKVHNDLKISPVGFDGSQVSKKIANQFMLQGIEIDYFKENKMKAYQQYAVDNAMPDYPEHGSIVLLGDVLILNLGTSAVPQQPAQPAYWSLYKDSRILQYFMSKIQMNE